MPGFTCETGARRRSREFTSWKSPANAEKDLNVSLFGALHLGGSSLAAQQTALQVTGNNIANAGTAGYSRQVVSLTSMPDVKTSSGQYVGSGVGVASVQRQVS